MQQEDKDATKENTLVLARENLKPCDIVLRAEKNVISKAIRLTTGGNYSHAMLYLDDCIIHATQDGIFTENPQRMQYSSADSAIVLRLKWTLPPEAIASIENYARSQVGAQYSIAEATAVVIGPRPQHSKKQFCSRLIAQAFLEAGIQIVPTPQYCSPQDIFESNLFEIVNDALRPPDEIDLTVAKRFNIAHQNRDAFYDWMKTARKLGKKEGWDILNLYEVHLFLEKFPQYSDEITNSIRQSGYLDTYKIDEQHNPHRFSIQECKKMIKETHGKAIYTFIGEAMQEIKISTRFIDNLEFVSHQQKNSFTTTMQELYINLLNFSLRKLDVFEQVLRDEQNEFAGEIFKAAFLLRHRKKQCEILIKCNIFG